MKRGKIHVKNTEKPKFLILKDDSILRTALSLKPKKKNDALVGARYIPETIRLVRATNHSLYASKKSQ